MALKITITKESPVASIAANAVVATVAATGGTTPYTYALATGSDKYNINSSLGVVTAKAQMDLTNIATFSILATDSTPSPVTATSDIVYPAITADIQSKFTRVNKVYKITKNIDLAHGTLVLPTYSTIDYQGGTIKNGVVVCDVTTIRNNNGNSSNATLEGTYTLEDALPDNEDLSSETGVVKFKDRLPATS